MRYIIGIDTGGTYTDGVLMENRSGRIRSRAKVATTHHDLGQCVSSALAALLADGCRPEEVARVAVSTTLATNAVVEGRGARVALFVFGNVRHFKLPVVANIFLRGGHDILGREEQPLDLEGLVDTLGRLRNEVDSYAVCSAMSINNPTHELVAEEAIGLVDPKPVFCSHRVSKHPGMRERAATACLHARLMPLMEEFLLSIQRSMVRVGLGCPVTVICGNGTGAELDQVIHSAAITMASGPAATACFGSSVSPDQTALIVDVGGTTTDVCMIRDGRPVMNEQGCRIGEWQTHVEAIDMYTGAGGGDTLVDCRPVGSAFLAQQRVQPLCLVDSLPDPATWLGCGDRSVLVTATVREGEGEDAVLAHLRNHGPATRHMLSGEVGLSGILLEKRLERMAYRHQVVLSGFTPTDALHVLGRLEIGSQQQAEAAARVLAQRLGMSTEAFCRHVCRLTEERIESIILKYLCRKTWGDQAAPFLDRRNNDLFSLNFSLRLPLIGIGAAGRCFLPSVAERLDTTVYFPEHCEVGNAIGAALIGAAVHRTTSRNQEEHE